MQKTYTFHVDGLHCQSCILLTQNELKEMPQITNVQTSLKTNSIQVTGDFGDKSEAELLPELSEILKPLGYTLSLNPTIKPVSWSDFAIAIPVALTFIFGFILLQKLGIVNLVNTSEVTYGTAFFVGLIASVSTCMAVVGGLVLSLSANFAKEGDKTKPQILFHIGRLVSFFLFGGIIGALGAFVQFNQTTSLVLGIFVAFVLASSRYQSFRCFSLGKTFATLYAEFT
ncbi:MAG: sulfite exporter TauE/SafE family protein [Candidatus Nomurabacteria bacterium]|nr:MAG: sulfite exporter TauE/SafE family protein [Candidatus Nomurabacteria bacterium]